MILAVAMKMRSKIGVSLGGGFVGNDIVMVQQDRQGDEQDELKNQAPCRIPAQQEARDDRADDGEHTGLDKGISDQPGHLPLAANHTVMPGRKPSTAASGSSLSRKLLRS